MAKIVFDHVTKSYPGTVVPAVDDVSLAVPAGSFVVLLGPSGCGKTTLLKMVNRLHEPSEGVITLDGVDTRSINLTDLRRQIGYVIQQVGLFPHMTIAQNIAVVPELMKWPRPKIDQRIDELLELVRLPLDFRNRYPAQLSGGQQQRVGLARALAADPQVMLMDEPFGAIDAITRANLQEQLLELQQRLHKTILFVNHDVDETLKLADEIVILSKGRLVQQASPCDLLTQPENDFVRELLNSDDRIRQFSLLKVETVMEPISQSYRRIGAVIEAGSDLRQELSLLLRPGVEELIVEASGEAIGVVNFKILQRVGCQQEGE